MIFVLDTNVLWKIQKLIRLAKAARLHGHGIEVPALAHAERLAQVRRGSKRNPARRSILRLWRRSS